MIGFGWETFKKRPWFFVGATCMLAIIQVVLQMGGLIPVAGSIVSTIVGVYVGMGVIRFSLRAHDSVGEASYDVIWNRKGFWRYLGSYFLMGLISAGPIAGGGIAAAIYVAAAGLPAAGSLLTSGFIIPVIIIVVLALAWLVYASARLTFVAYLVLEAGKGPVEAVKESFRITQWSVGKIVLFSFALVLLNILGAIALLVGLLVTIPVSMLAMAHLYRTLYVAPVASPAPAAPTSPDASAPTA